MKILICIDSLRKGGAERVVSNLSNYLVHYHDVMIVTMSRTKPGYWLEKKVKIEAVEPHGFKNRWSALRSRVRRLSETLSSYKPDVVLTFLPYASMVALLTNRSYSGKIIVSVRNDPAIEYKSLKYRFLKRCLYPRADGFVMQTDRMKNYFASSIRRKTVVIPNPINPEFIGEMPSSKRRRVIVNVGRLYHQKNHKMLLDAFALVTDEYPDYKLEIYGDGPLRDELEYKIMASGMSNRISLKGNVDNVKDKIKDASCFVLSSDYEGMPNALMEAMALGLPVISTDCPCGGPEYLIENNKNGILVGVNRPQELAEAIRKVLGNKDFANSISRRAQDISKRLNPDTINAKWKKYIEKVVADED